MGLSNKTLDFSFNQDDSKLWLDLGLGSSGFCRPEVRQIYQTKDARQCGWGRHQKRTEGTSLFHSLKALSTLSSTFRSLLELDLVLHIDRSYQFITPSLRTNRAVSTVIESTP